MYFSIFNTHFSKTPCRPTIAGMDISLTKEQFTTYKHRALAIFILLLQISFSLLDSKIKEKKICCGIHPSFNGYFKELVPEKYNIRKHWKHIQPSEYSWLSRKHKYSRKQNSPDCMSISFWLTPRCSTWEYLNTGFITFYSDKVILLSSNIGQYFLTTLL